MIADIWHSPPVRCARGFAPPSLERAAACGGEIVQSFTAARTRCPRFRQTLAKSQRLSGIFTAEPSRRLMQRAGAPAVLISAVHASGIDVSFTWGRPRDLSRYRPDLRIRSPKLPRKWQRNSISVRSVAPLMSRGLDDMRIQHGRARRGWHQSARSCIGHP